MVVLPAIFRQGREVVMVKCAECGFLGLRNIQTNAMEEATEQYRDHGTVPQGEIGGKPGLRNLFKPEPLCFKRAFNLASEIGNTGKPAAKLKVLNEDRTCQLFVEWQQGYTPREHAEMIREETLLKSQREREREDREWRQEQAENDRRWRKEDQENAKASMNTNVRTTLIAAVIGFFSALTAVALAYILAGAAPK